MTDKLPQTPQSYWRQTTDLPEFDTLHENIQTDAVIVGGGITGITAAYLLQQQGMNVVLLDAGRLLNGTTGHTTAKITAQHGLIYDEIIQHMGKSKARLYYEANSHAMQFIEQTVRDLNISCGFMKQDAYLYATTEDYAKKLEKEWEAYQTLSIDGQLDDTIPFSVSTHKVLSMPNQAQFHPLQYLADIVQAFQEKGGKIFEHTVAVNVESSGQQAAVLTKNGRRVTGKYVLACTHFPFYEGRGLYSAKMYADRSYILAVKTKEAYPGGMYLSVDEPARSLRSLSLPNENIVLIGGESHKTGQGKDTQTHYEALHTFANKLFQVEDIVYRWSAQDLITLDKLPYVGPVSTKNPRVLIATGYRKWGMTNGTAAAQLLTDIVLHKENPYQELFSPARFYADPSLKKFFIENADVAKHLIKGKVQLPNTSYEDLKRDQGAVVLIDGKRKGAYKDQDGQMHIVDTTCTHVGCEVEWNHGDRTWDCPCHGSRFSYTGEVIEGPAEKPLQKEDFTMLDNATDENSGY
ncbi:Glycine/D-amino acid oxidase [Alteribacillus persepolensis]|uniref:Glycine/D-amino acid oxidase n=1 Tax=Alteribacillus persepolensis TaxID=568899 RepID=A0A1G7Z3G5_9BACI|nr:FAD-dependent oxidoreductase [Alteribacillus persepolensis]SDH03311.1 Glycine/D-amino acid oxidase [Alteribacillus persepolensis]